MRRLVPIWLVLVACGRIGFDRGADVDAPVGSNDGRLSDGGLVDGSTSGCAYLTSCTMGEVTCCTDMNMTRTCTSNPQSCNGVIAECDLGTQQGCLPGWACCGAVDAASRCYDPQLPLPC